MARQKSRTKTKLFSAGSEMRKGYTMPTIKKIKSVLRSRSKTFLINCIMSMFSKLSKPAKIKFLMKIDKRQVKRKAKKRSTRKGQRRKTARRAYTPKKKSKGRKGKGFQGKPKGSQAEKKAIAKALRARKRR